MKETNWSKRLKKVERKWKINKFHRTNLSTFILVTNRLDKFYINFFHSWDGINFHLHLILDARNDQEIPGTLRTENVWKLERKLWCHYFAKRPQTCKCWKHRPWKTSVKKFSRPTVVLTWIPFYIWLFCSYLEDFLSLLSVEFFICFVLPFLSFMIHTHKEFTLFSTSDFKKFINVLVDHRFCFGF